MFCILPLSCGHGKSRTYTLDMVDAQKKYPKQNTVITMVQINLTIKKNRLQNGLAKSQNVKLICVERAHLFTFLCPFLQQRGATAAQQECVPTRRFFNIKSISGKSCKKNSRFLCFSAWLVVQDVLLQSERANPSVREDHLISTDPRWQLRGSRSI